MMLSDPACTSGSRTRIKLKIPTLKDRYPDGTTLVPFSKTGRLPVLCPLKDREVKKMKNERGAFIAVNVIMALMGLAAIVLIIISMVTDKVTPYLAISLCLSGFANIFGCIYRNRKREKEDGSCENRNIS